MGTHKTKSFKNIVKTVSVCLVPGKVSKIGGELYILFLSSSQEPAMLVSLNVVEPN